MRKMWTIFCSPTGKRTFNQKVMLDRVSVKKDDQIGFISVRSGSKTTHLEVEESDRFVFRIWVLLYSDISFILELVESSVMRIVWKEIKNIARTKIQYASDILSRLWKVWECRKNGIVLHGSVLKLIGCVRENSHFLCFVSNENSQERRELHENDYMR